MRTMGSWVDASWLERLAASPKSWGSGGSLPNEGCHGTQDSWEFLRCELCLHRGHGAHSVKPNEIAFAKSAEVWRQLVLLCRAL